MNRLINRLLSRILIVLLLTCTILSVNVYSVHAETENPVDISLVVDNAEGVSIHGLFVGYDDNLYVSLLDLQRMLLESNKEFKYSIKEGVINIYTYEALHGDILESIPEITQADRETSGWSEEDIAGFSNNALSANGIFVNEIERKYYTILTTVGGYKDCYIHISDISMILDLDSKREGLTLSIDTSNGMSAPNPMQLESEGFFQCVNSVIVGDATTGEIFYGYRSDEVYPIASTTKLMTYLIMEDAVQSGAVSYSDMVTFDKEAELISGTSDGLIPVKEGQSAPLIDMMKAALIISSNECDHAVSAHVGGSEQNVVELMQNKAKEIGMTTAQFYNCNGLPNFSETLYPAKKQNRMSSYDMFKLVSHILNTYPQVKDITSIKYDNLESLHKEVKNTNPMLYNMPEVTGLKTGTTNKSGACLVTSLIVNDGNVDHDLVVVVLGAEGSPDRGRVSEVLARYAKAVVLGQAQKVSQDKAEVAEIDKTSANSIVNMIVTKAMQNKNAQ